MRPETPKLLEDIRDAGDYLLAITAGKTAGDVARDRMLRQTIERNFEIIGEAVNRIRKGDPDTVSRITHATRIVAFRNVLIHAYDVVDHEVVWRVVQDDLPLLCDEVKTLLREAAPPGRTAPEAAPCVPPAASPIADVLVVGGGVIGLSVAECAARRGMKVLLLERERVASRASWAGAGMLNCRPWPREKRDEPDYIDLIQASVKLHEQWAARLREETDMDVGFRRCGAVELCTHERATAEKGLEQLERLAEGCAARGVPCQRLTPADVRGVEPHVDTADIAGALLLPDDAQIRTPRFARALALACRQREVTIVEGVTVVDLCVANGRVTGVEAADGGRYNAASVVMCAGAWTAQFPALTRAAPRAGRVEPVRGQILCYQTPAPLCTRLLTVSEQYACPRPDGILLIGSTTEKMGFEAVTTPDAQAQLKLFAEALLPELRTITPFQGWADLRPGLKGLHPLLGPVPGVQGLYIAAGHYRNGLCLAPVTGEIIAALLAHEPPPVAAEPWVPKPA